MVRVLVRVLVRVRVLVLMELRPQQSSRTQGEARPLGALHQKPRVQLLPEQLVIYERKRERDREARRPRAPGGLRRIVTWHSRARQARPWWLLTRRGPQGGGKRGACDQVPIRIPACGWQYTAGGRSETTRLASAGCPGMPRLLAGSAGGAANMAAWCWCCGWGRSARCEVERWGPGPRGDSDTCFARPRGAPPALLLLLRLCRLLGAAWPGPAKAPRDGGTCAGSRLWG